MYSITVCQFLAGVAAFLFFLFCSLFSSGDQASTVNKATLPKCVRMLYCHSCIYNRVLKVYFWSCQLSLLLVCIQ